MTSLGRWEGCAEPAPEMVSCGHGGVDSKRERGAALLELAISIPVFLLLLGLIFDAGLGFAAVRDTATATRSAARIAAVSGDDRMADFRAINAIRSEYDNNRDTVVWVTIYRSEVGSEGKVPPGCGIGSIGVPGLCNVYDGASLAGITRGSFANDDCGGNPDANWCPTDRADDTGGYLGVAVWVDHPPTIGLYNPSGDPYELEERAVFPLFIDPTEDT